MANSIYQVFLDSCYYSLSTLCRGQLAPCTLAKLSQLDRSCLRLDSCNQSKSQKRRQPTLSQNRLSSVADVCASPKAQGMDISDDIPNGGVFSRYIAQNLYGRKNFRYNLISFSKITAYSFAPISACISISTSCVGRFNSLMPIQVQHGRLSLKNSE